MKEAVIVLIDVLIGEQSRRISLLTNSINKHELSVDEFDDLEEEERMSFFKNVYENYKNDYRLDWIYFEDFYKSLITKKRRITNDENDPVIQHLIKKYKKKALANNKKFVSRKYTEQGYEEIYSVGIDDVFSVAIEELRRALCDIYNEEHRKTFKSILDFYRKDLKILSSLREVVQMSNFDSKKCFSLLEELNMPTAKDSKERLISMINKYAEAYEKELEEKRIQAEIKKLEMKSKEIPKEIHEVEPEKAIYLHINNYEFLEPAIDRYGTFILAGITKESLNEDYSLSDLKQIMDYSFIDVDAEVFKDSLNSLLFYLDKATYIEDKRMYQGIIINLCDKYEKYNDYKELETGIKLFYGKPELTTAELNTLNGLQNLINRIKESKDDYDKLAYMETIENELVRIRKERNTEIDEVTNKTKIKGFVLFDYELVDNKKKAYITNDLNPNYKNNLIDESADRSKVGISGYRDIGNLIDIITTTGDLGETVLNDPKLIRPVFKDIGNGTNIKTEQSNATKMLRIRPRNSSLARFIERRFEFKAGSSKTEQLKKIFERVLPGAEVTGNFVIFINYLSFIKCKDLNPYKIAKTRYNNSVITRILDDKDKELFTKEELKIIEDVLVLTINANKELKKYNSSYKVDIVDDITKTEEKNKDK